MMMREYALVNTGTIHEYLQAASDADAVAQAQVRAECTGFGFAVWSRETRENVAVVAPSTSEQASEGRVS